MLIELELKEKGVSCPLIGRLFFDTDTGGLSTMPVMAERGKDNESAIAKHIERCIKSSNHKHKDPE